MSRPVFVCGRGVERQAVRAGGRSGGQFTVGVCCVFLVAYTLSGHVRSCVVCIVESHGCVKL